MWLGHIGHVAFVAHYLSMIQLAVTESDQLAFRFCLAGLRIVTLVGNVTIHCSPQPKLPKRQEAQTHDQEQDEQGNGVAMSAAIEQRNQDATVYVGNLDDKVTEELLWELMLQAGSVINVHMPRDKVTNTHQNYGFVEFRTEECAEYALKVMNMVQLYGKVVRVKKASQDKKNLDIGANLFIGNLDPEVDEKLLYDTFSAFGGIIETPKVMRDSETKVSRGFGFISFDSFEASDLAIECMNGQYLCNRQVVVQYAYKKDSNNERHGSEAERLLAQSNPNKLKPNTRFAFTTPAGGASAAEMIGNGGAAPMAPPPPPPMAHMNGGGYMAPMGMMAPPPPPPPPQSMGMGGMGMYQMGGMAPPPPPPPMPAGMMMGGHGMPPPPPPPARY